MEIAFVLYDGFTGLDLIGPYEVIGAWPDARVRFVATRPGPVTADAGLTVVCSRRGERCRPRRTFRLEPDERPRNRVGHSTRFTGGGAQIPWSAEGPGQ
jgi:putative intracellular protease/amidase